MKKDIISLSIIVIVIMIAECVQSQSNDKSRGSRKSSTKKTRLQTNHLSWKTMLPDGRVIDETAKIIPREKKMYIRSKRIPEGSGFSNSSTLMYFNKNQLIVKFYFTSNGRLQEACFLSRPVTDYDTTRREIQRRTTSAIPISSGTAYRRMVASKRIVSSDLKKMGKSIFVFCRKAAAKGLSNVFSLLEEADVRSSTNHDVDPYVSSSPTYFLASGLVSPMRRSTSVPFLVEVEHSLGLH